MTPSQSLLTLNILPPEKLFCDFSYFSNKYPKDMSFIWESSYGIPLNKLPADAIDLIFPYLLLALADYKISSKKKLKGIGLDNLLCIWFDKYCLNKNGYFELVT